MNREDQPFYPMTNMWMEWCPDDDEPEIKIYWLVLGYFMEYYDFDEEESDRTSGVNLYYLVINEDGTEHLCNYSRDQRLIYSTINPDEEDNTFRAYTSPDYTKSNRKELLALSIDKLPLSKRAIKCLRRENIECINDLVNSSESKIMQIPYIGKKYLNEIKNTLSYYGLNLAGD